MGCCFSKTKDDSNFPQFGKKKGDDQNSLLTKNNSDHEIIYQPEATAAPLLKDINFAAINDDNNEQSSTSDSIDNEEIEQLLAEEEDQKEKAQHKNEESK